MKIISHILKNIIFIIRPFLGQCTCRYTLTCTQYAYQQLDQQPCTTAIVNIIKRIFSCNPFTIKK